MAGHGSPRGVRQGGRCMGTPNKRTLERQAEMDELLAAGDSPLAYMLKVMRDARAEPATRRDAARAAAPYCHPRLSGIDVGSGEGGALIIELVQFNKEDLKNNHARPLPYSATEALPARGN
jgi:hypothetical protein